MESVQLSLSSADGNLLEINEKTVTQAMNSYLCSAKYLRHVVPLTMFYIVHNRIEYDSKYFINTNIKDWKYVILNKDNQHDELTNLYTLAYGAMEALQKGCLTQLFLKIIDNNETVEYYRYSFLYSKNPPVTRPKGSSKDIIKITRDWFQNFSILKTFSKLPSNAKLSVEVVLNEKPNGLILLNYVEIDKSDVYNQDNGEAVKNLLCLGEISTHYHKVRAYSKIKSVQDSDAAEIIEGQSLVDQLGHVQVDASNESTVLNSGRITDNRLNIDDVVTDNIPKRSKQKSKDNENDNMSTEAEAPIKEVSIENVSRKDPTVLSDVNRLCVIELMTQHIINCKKHARKEQNKTTTLFGDTTIDIVEEEESVCTHSVPPNESSIQRLETFQSNKSNKNDDRSNTLKKILKKTNSNGKKGTIIDGEGMCDMGKMRDTTSRESLINSYTQRSLESTAPKVMKKPGEKANVTVILDDISITANLLAPLNGECDKTSDITSPSELYINNEVVPKAKKHIKSRANSAKKSKTKCVNDVPNRENENSNNMSKRKTKSPIHITAVNKLIFPQSRNVGNGSFIEDHRNQLERNSNLIPSDSVQTTLNEEPEKAPEQLTHTEMYTDNITSLTPKKKRKAPGNAKSDRNAGKKRKTIIAHNDAHSRTEIVNYKENRNESISTKYRSTESMDSTTLGDGVKKISIAIEQPLVDSTQLGGSQSIELFPAATELNRVNISTYKDKQITNTDDDYHSISSGDSDMDYINNRVQFN